MIDLKEYILQNITWIWIFNMKHLLYLFFIFLSACSSWGGKGQIIYHWERERTGVAKFSRDHSECLKQAEGWLHWPDFSSWFYSEEYRYNIVVDWQRHLGQLRSLSRSLASFS